MVIYYRDETVQITSSTVQIDGRSYPLRELARVWHRANGRNPRTLLTRVAFGIAPLAPVVAAAGLVALGLQLDTAAGRLVLLLLAGAVLLTIVPLLDLVLGHVERTYDRGTTVHEIWARWRGREVLLLRTGDRMRFGRIYRALERALEQS